MRGFKITCKTEKGEVALLTDLNTNTKVFTVHHVKQKPFIEIAFLFNRTPTGIMMRKMFEKIPEEEALKHLVGKLEENGSVRGVDFDVCFIDGLVETKDLGESSVLS